jgi:magnesium chelatase family protein
MRGTTSQEGSNEIYTRVIAARAMQTRRFAKQTFQVNALMDSPTTRKICQLDQASELRLKTAMQRLSLSARAYDRILKVARTIADLNQSEQIQLEHLTEAIAYRSLDRENWGG